MKTFRKIIFALSMLAGISSCDYLNVVPDSIATIDYAFRNKAQAEKYLNTCYSYRPTVGEVYTDPGMSGSDEIWTIVNTWVNNLRQAQQSATTPAVSCWDGTNNAKKLWEGIRCCNILLENIDKAYDLSDGDKKRWKAEAKFLKAYYHFYLMKCFGPIPITDVNLPISASVDEVKVYRDPVDKVVEYIANLLKDAARDLPNASEIVEGTEAGRADKLAALTMRADVLLYAASPLFNGNTDYASVIDNRGVALFPQAYDPEKWKLAAQACKEAIDTCHAQKKALYDQVDPLVAAQAPAPFQLQTTYRQAICDRWNKELIWGNTSYNCSSLSSEAQARIVQLKTELLNGVKTQWAPTIKMVEMYYSKNGVPISEDKEWQVKGWYANRFTIRPEASSGDDVYYVHLGEKTVYLHYNREPRFYASLGFDKGVYYGNGYYSFPSTVKYCNFFRSACSGKAGMAGYSITGYSVKKMHSYKNSQTPTALGAAEYFPFPVYRLADLYLMYAEALNEAYGPTDEAFTYLDKIRARAGLMGIKESWALYSTNSEKPNTKEGLRQIIHQERQVELAFESKRFWDIRRWKEIDNFNSLPLGWNVVGETAEDFYKLVVVSQVPINFTVKDYFWPIRENNLTVNPNLVQNYGW